MSEQTANWAILVYISADRVLTNFAVESLKQLKRSAGERTIALVQVHSSNQEGAQRYVFDGKSNPASSIEADRVRSVQPPLSPGGISDPANLTKFIEWASQYDAKHRCLFLWGHGYELLLNEDATDSAQTSGRNYLTPKALREALENAKRNIPEARLDIIGIDACSMSLVELASELAGFGDFMIASQEDVPDQSFPYEEVLQKLEVHAPDDVEGISAAIPGLYRQAYQDYVVGADTGTREITLTSIRLKNTGRIQEPLTRLSTALLSSVLDPSLRAAILYARKMAREFALGLFVDLHDFCSRLSEKLADGELKSACDAIRGAIDARGPDACILENQSGDNEVMRCHGLSIYFPYLAKTEMDQARQAFLAGGTDLVDQLPLLIKGGTNHLEKARSVKIREIEEDLKSLIQFEKTRWTEFIKRGWSVILATEEANELDEHYSAQQCATNLLSLCQPPPPPPPGGTSRLAAAAS
jgi:hypothetical protein